MVQSPLQQQPKPAADPFAFDMSAFGTEFQPPGRDPLHPETGDIGKAEQSSHQAKQQADPYAFDMSAFGEDHMPIRDAPAPPRGPCMVCAVLDL